MQWNIPVKSQPNPSAPAEVLGESVMIQKCSMNFPGQYYRRKNETSLNHWTWMSCILQN